MRIVRCGDNWAGEGADWPYGERVMVERYVPGREITVAVMGERALGALEIRPAQGHFYDYTAKYAPGGSVHLMPAPIHADAYRDALDIALPRAPRARLPRRKPKPICATTTRPASRAAWCCSRSTRSPA